MPWFFSHDPITTETYTITGEDASHISRSLRMRAGETLTLCSPDGRRHDCTILSFTPDTVTVCVNASTVCEQEPSARVTLFVALQKGDNLDDVIQKAVELGVYEVTPFLSARCISRPDAKSLSKKTARWQKIASSAASQSRRGIIPRVNPCVDLRDIPSLLQDFDRAVVCYECGGEALRAIIRSDDASIALITGCEGGFEESEIALLRNAGVRVATLGKRILRARTAPIAVLCAAMMLTQNFE